MTRQMWHARMVERWNLEEKMKRRELVVFFFENEIEDSSFPELVKNHYSKNCSSKSQK